ncbi:uncharacterized protein LOC122536183 [Frieseomelitta varia]|uniref:uncharacterized protein LOC122536183 n=1 Tax=Frieseomelitta varia TaxID=561572 RepID=UPI001CB6A7E6|nr:uncharacterized protein LOC122536183 [Frieseomelitta varia]
MSVGLETRVYNFKTTTQTLFVFVPIVVPVHTVSPHPLLLYFLKCCTRRVKESHLAVEFHDNNTHYVALVFPSQSSISLVWLPADLLVIP